MDGFPQPLVFVRDHPIGGISSRPMGRRAVLEFLFLVPASTPPFPDPLPVQELGQWLHVPRLLYVLSFAQRIPLSRTQFALGCSNITPLPLQAYGWLQLPANSQVPQRLPLALFTLPTPLHKRLLLNPIH